jgi:dihydroorotate dehydrogenase
VEGLIVANTTISRPDELIEKDVAMTLPGGLSGPVLRPLATKCISEIYKLTGGTVSS